MVIILSNYLDAPLGQMVIEVHDILLEDDLIELDAAVLDSYAGEYHARLPDGRETTIRITRVGDHLILNDIGSNLLGFFPLYPLSPERFIQKFEDGYGSQFDFQIDGSDKISQIIIDDVFIIEFTHIEQGWRNWFTTNEVAEYPRSNILCSDSPG